MHKKILAVVFAVVILSTSVPPITVLANSQEFVSVRLSMYSNLSDRHYIYGYYNSDVFFISLTDLAEISGADITDYSRNSADLSLNGGLRRFTLHVNDNAMVEHFARDAYTFEMPIEFKNGLIYVSALDFLHYIGADIRLNQHASVQFMVAVRYNFFHALLDYGLADWGHFFKWCEISYLSNNLELRLIDAGLNALIDRNSNFFVMALNPQSIVQDAMEDTLMDIITIGSVPHLQETADSTDFINLTNRIVGTTADATNMANDIFDFVFDVLSDGEDGMVAGVAGDVFESFSNHAEAFGLSAMLLNNALNEVEGARAFERVTMRQRDLLAPIVYQHRFSPLIDEATGRDRRYMDTIIDASRNVYRRAGSNYQNEIAAARNMLRNTAVDLATSAVTDKNPMAMAWTIAVQVNRWNPNSAERLRQDIQLYNAYNASLIQQVAAEIVNHNWTRLHYSNYHPLSFESLLDQHRRHAGHADTRELLQLEYMNDMRDAMVLQLKATITTRESLLNSGVLTGAESARMRHLNQETAVLLNRVINAHIVGVGVTRRDGHGINISWMADFVMPQEIQPSFNIYAIINAYYEF